MTGREDQEPDGRLVKWTRITLFRDRDNDPDIQDVSTGILGWCWYRDEPPGRRKVWGLATPTRAGDPHEMSPISYLMDGHSSPLLVLSRLEKGGSERFVFHAGENLWTTVAELRRAFRELGLVAPERYRGVMVPEALRANWDQPETHWWRRGIQDALESAAEDLLIRAMGSHRGQT